MAAKALDNQPCVGMIDGVAASLSVCEAMLSAAALNDEASRLARRINAFTSTRTSAVLRSNALDACAGSAAESAGPPMPAAWTCGLIGSRSARRRILASRWEMRAIVSERVVSRPCSSPSSSANR